MADQATKYWAESRLSEQGGGAMELFGGAQFRLVYNSGAAWSFGSNLGQLIAVFAIIMLVFLIRIASKRPDAFGRVVLCVIAGGVIGNFIDRLANKGFPTQEGLFAGEVVDFVDVGIFNFAVFNIADSAIVVGTALLIGHAFLFPEDTAKPAEEAEVDEEDLNEENLPEEEQDGKNSEISDDLASASTTDKGSGD